MSDLVKTELKAVMLPQNFKEACTFADYIAKSDLAPKDYKGKPQNVLIAMQMGAEVGLQPMQAIQNIAIINGRPSLWGDSLLAVCLPHIDDFKEDYDANANGYTCTVKRGKVTTSQSFTEADARKANLWGKAGPWTAYPKRMLQMRARGFALRDACPDVLKGIHSAEEVSDYEKEPIKIKPKPQPKPEPIMEKTVEDHPHFLDLLNLVESNELGAELNTVSRSDDWRKLSLRRFEGVQNYVTTKVNEIKAALEAEEVTGEEV